MLLVIMVFWEVFLVRCIGSWFSVLLVFCKVVLICKKWCEFVVGMINEMFGCVWWIVLMVLRNIGNSVFIFFFLDSGNIVNSGLVIGNDNVCLVFVWLGVMVIVLVIVWLIKV